MLKFCPRVRTSHGSTLVDIRRILGPYLHLPSPAHEVLSSRGGTNITILAQPLVLAHKLHKCIQRIQHSLNVNMLNHYQTLNVSFSADLAAIKKAYHKISLLHHPNETVHIPATERAQREHLFKLANVAFEALSDPHKRKAYDQNLYGEQNRPKTRDGNTTASPPNGHEPPGAWPQYGHRPHPPQQHGRGPPPPPRSSTAKPGGTRVFQDPQGPQGARLSTHRFSATTLGTSSDFNWCHCELNE